MFDVRGLEHREFPQLSLHQSSVVYLWFICEVQDYLQTIVLGEVMSNFDTFMDAVMMLRNALAST